LEGTAGLRVLVTLVSVALIACIVLVAQLVAVDVKLSAVRVKADGGSVCVEREAGGFDEDCVRLTPHGIVDWELAFTKEKAEEILETWARPEVDLLQRVEESLELDRFLIAAYVVLLTALLLLVARKTEGGGRGWWLLVAVLPVLAGVLDVIENAFLIKQLPSGNVGTVAVEASHVLIAGVAASLKFLLITGSLCALGLAAVACVCFALGRPRVQTREQLAKVLEKEGEYIDSRRKHAKLPATCENRRPVGLAFSGGGIRSATLNLGALQALARMKVLPNFDYLSTVSGGGYIGSALSSLLSINRSRMSDSRKGSSDQYRFGASDSPLFSTEAHSFPFEQQPGPEESDESSGESDFGLDAEVQLEHLHASGEFLVQQRRLFSLEFLRTVGSVAFGFLYHLVLFGLLFVSIASVYLWVIYMMVGQKAMRCDPMPYVFDSGGVFVAAPVERVQARGVCFEAEAAASTELATSYLGYAKEALGAGVEGPGWHPFLVAVAIGAIVTLLTIVLGSRLIPSLRSTLFERRGRSDSEIQQQVEVVGLVAIMLTAAIGIIWWYVRVDPHRLLNISLALMSYLGGGLVLFARHVWVAARRHYGHIDRSRLAARQGAFGYLTVASFIFVLFILPFLVFFDTIAAQLAATPIRSMVAWVLSLLGARAIAGGGEQSGTAEKRGGFLGRVFRLAPALRKVFMGTVFAVALVGGFLLICAWIWTHEPSWLKEDGFLTNWLGIDSPFGVRLGIALIALGLCCLFGLPNFNKLALHYSYRDRLAEAYLQTMKQGSKEPRTLEIVRDSEALTLDDLHGNADTEAATSAPYHLIVACLNLSAERDRRRRARKTDQFIFSKHYCGSEITGFVPTPGYRGGKTELAEAMTISGAAASPAMGRRTFFAQSAAMTLLNVRLGQWLENPGYLGGCRTDRREKRVFWPWYLLKEALGSTDANSRLVYLSDGGHTGDNLGICPLLRRRCRLIVAIDAEFDPQITCGSLIEALRQVRIDNVAKVEIDLDVLRPDSNTRLSDRHVAVGRITYPGTPTKQEETGWLVVLKSSLTGDESELVCDYRRQYPVFPHQSTGDQFFDEAQFEAYRELGEHMVESSLGGDLLELVRDSICDADWQARFEALVPGAPSAS
jgi:hypothetical protein